MSFTSGTARRGGGRRKEDRDKEEVMSNLRKNFTFIWRLKKNIFFLLFFSLGKM